MLRYSSDGKSVKDKCIQPPFELDSSNSRNSPLSNVITPFELSATKTEASRAVGLGILGVVSSRPHVGPSL